MAMKSAIFVWHLDHYVKFKITYAMGKTMLQCAVS